MRLSEKLRSEVVNWNARYPPRLRAQNWRRRMCAQDRLAEGEELGSNILHVGRAWACLRGGRSRGGEKRCPLGVPGGCSGPVMTASGSKAEVDPPAIST